MIHRVPSIVRPDGTPFGENVAPKGLCLSYRAEFFEPRKFGLRATREIPSSRILRGLGWRRFAVRTGSNMVPTSGVNKYLDATLKTGLASPLWYCSTIVGAGVPTFNIADTMASHAGWLEMTGANVTAGVRGTITWGAISGGSVDNSLSLISYTVAAAQAFTCQGFFVCDNNTIGGTSNTLLSEAAFDGGPQAVTAGNVFTIQVTAIMVAG